eukprot:4795507-Pleurochrysis_carterae.AAC.1
MLEPLPILMDRIHLLDQLSRALNGALPKQSRDFISRPRQLLEEQGNGQGRSDLVGLEKKGISKRASR